MRRLIPLVLIAVTGLAACGSSVPVGSSETTMQPTTLPTAAPVPPTDAGEPPGPNDPPATLPVPDALVGPTWVLESFITVGPLDIVPAGVVATLRFDSDGTLAVETGCNSGTARAGFLDEGSFVVTDLVLTEIACDGAAGAVETRVVAQLGHDLYWSIDGDVLSVYPTDVTDTGLRLRAAT